MGNVKLLDRFDYTAVNGKTYLVIHGDFFDALMVNQKWLMHIGDTLYDFMIWFNTHFNKVRFFLRLPYWSLSKWLKDNTKQAVSFIQKYEDHVADYCRGRGYDGIICGHIHHAEIKHINGVEYMNDGDWVESGTALLEHTDGTFEIYWHDKTNTDNNRQSSESD